MGDVPLRRPDRQFRQRPGRRDRRRRDDELHAGARARRLCRAGRLGDERFASERRRRPRRAPVGRSAAPNSLVFATPPASGAAIAASFAYAFLCRFDDDAAEFEQAMQNLWRLDSLKFRSVRSS